MGIGSSGAEGLAATHLTSSLDNSMLNASMPVFDPSVKPVPKDCLHLIPSSPKTCTDALIRQPSDAPMVGRRFNRCS